MAVNRGAYRNKVPKITWGAAFANTLTFAQPLDDAISYHEENDTTSTPAKNGDEDSWTMGRREFLQGIVHRIPREDTGGVTGWEGSTGWDAFLEWAYANPFRFYGDAAASEFRLSHLEAPIDEDHGEEINRFRSIEIVMSSDDLLPYTGY